MKICDNVLQFCDIQETAGPGSQRMGPSARQQQKSPGFTPYLLRNGEIQRPNQIGSTDIPYIPLQGGYVYLTTVIDWYSRYILTWRLSNSLVDSGRT